MLPRKKLDYYAHNHGIEHMAAVRMTEEDVAAVCQAVGSKQFTLSDCGGRLSNLIDCITDDPTYREKVRAKMTAAGKVPSEDMFLIRMGDRAAADVMAAYAALHPAN